MISNIVYSFLGCVLLRIFRRVGKRQIQICFIGCFVMRLQFFRGSVFVNLYKSIIWINGGFGIGGGLFQGGSILDLFIFFFGYLMGGVGGIDQKGNLFYQRRKCIRLSIEYVQSQCVCKGIFLFLCMFGNILYVMLLKENIFNQWVWENVMFLFRYIKRKVTWG